MTSIRSDAAPVLASGPVAGVTRLSATDTVRARITLALELGLLKLGERLPDEPAIAEALDVSPATVRRALKALADDGFLDRRRGRAGGTFVARVGAAAEPAAAAFRGDAAEIHRLIDMRALAEEAFAGSAARIATASGLDELSDCVSAAASAEDWTSYHAADRRFHLTLASLSDHEWARATFGELLRDLYRYFLPYPISYLHDVNQEHAQLVEALRAGEGELAASIAREHVLALHSTMFVGLDERRAEGHAVDPEPETASITGRSPDR